MNCEHCGKNEATVHVTEIHNGKKETHHYCQNCASGHVHWQHPFDAFGGDFFKNFFVNPSFEEEKKKSCPHCGMSLAEFNQSGFFGCADCYQTFQEEIFSLLERMQGSTRHLGKVPSRGYGVFTTTRQIQRLQQQLQQALQQEKYEEAARLRDEIRSLQSKGEGA